MLKGNQQDPKAHEKNDIDAGKNPRKRELKAKTSPAFTIAA